MYYYRLIMKGRNEPDIVIAAHIVDREKLRDKFGEENHWIQITGEKFNCIDVKRCIKFWEVDYKTPQEQYVEVSEDQRLKNMHKTRMLKGWLMHKKFRHFPNDFTEEDQAYCRALGKSLEEKWAGSDYQSRRVFKKDFFDVHMVNDEDEERIYQEWLLYFTGIKDPRQYDKDKILFDARKPISQVIE